MSNTAQVQTQNAVVAPKTFEERFGKGRYFAIQCEVFKDTQRIFSASDEHAEAVAKAIATRLGAIFASGQVSLKGVDGKLNADGQLKTISEVCKIKNLTMCNEVAYLRAVGYINQAFSFHVKLNHPELVDEVREWFVMLDPEEVKRREEAKAAAAAAKK